MIGMKKGQGTFEYILLLAGVLLIVVLAIVLLRGGIFQGSQANIQKDSCQTALVQSSSCYDAAGTWNPSGNVSVPGPCVQFATPTVSSCSATSAFGECSGGSASACAFCCAQKPG